MELHCRDRLLAVLERHDHAVLGLGRHEKLRWQSRGVGENRVIAANGDFLRQPGEDHPVSVDPYPRRLSVHRHMKLAKCAAIGFGERLQAQADPEDRQAALARLVDRRLAIEVLRTARPRRKDDEVGSQAVEGFFRNRRPDRHHRCTGLAEIIGQRMYETVLVVHQQDRQSLAHTGSLARGIAGISGRRLADRRQHRRCLQLRLGFFFLRIGIEEQRRAGADFRDPVLDADRTQGEPGVHVAVEMNHPDRPAIPGARALLVVLDEPHRPQLRRAGNSDRPGVRQESVEGIHTLAQPALDVVDRMDQPRVHLDLPPANDAHRTRLAHTALVVAIDIRAHRQLGLVLLGVEQLEDLLRIRDRILAALDRA